MTEATKNPFRPGVGTPPLYLAGREGSQNRFKAILRSAPEIPANMRMTGLRGVGKTVLLNRFAELARTDNWFPGLVELQPGHNNEESLSKLISNVLKTSRAKISVTEKIKQTIGTAIENSGGLSVSWSELTVAYEPQERDNQDLARELYDTTDIAVKKGYDGYILLLDEAQVIRDDTSSDGQHPLSMLIATISNLQKNNIPIGLVLCGLPTLASNLLKARSYTERMFRGEKISSLDQADARVAFTTPLSKVGMSAEKDLVEEVITEVEGYPYFVQLWGAEMFDAAMIAGTNVLTRSLLDTIRSEIYQRLDFDFYEPRVSTLTPAEQDILLATVNCSYPPLIVSDLKDATEKTPKNINVLLGRLNEAGVIYRLRKGQYEYTAPKFREYLERHVENQP